MGENSNKKHRAVMPQYESILVEADQAAKREFAAWQAKYLPVEREILASRARREESKRRRATARKRAFADLCEMTEGLAVYCRRKGVSLEKAERDMQSHIRRRRRPYTLAFFSLFEDAWSMADFVRKELTKRIDRVRHEAMRPHYYAQERARRQALAEERRRIRRRRTLNPCPTREELLDAWTHIKDSPEALLRFGSLMEDLECYVDNSLRRTEDGVITGRRSGIKGWLQMEIPALYLKYTTVMAHKAAAKRMRQILEVNDPVPLSLVLNVAHTTIKDKRKVSKTTKDYGADEVKCQGAGIDGVGREDVAIEDGEKACSTAIVMESLSDGMCEICDSNTGTEKGKHLKICSCVFGGVFDEGIQGDNGALEGDETREVALLRARALYLEVMKPVGEGRRKQTLLWDRLWALTDPDKVEDANMLVRWRVKYENKITVRTKSLWIERLGWNRIMRMARE
ncbi:MAG: hypothetical protein IKZ36_03910 [Kiritimatiellae bacterium]|nr:hypothetical protein [Kiritimatiellia bacterium]